MSISWKIQILAQGAQLLNGENLSHNLEQFFDNLHHLVEMATEEADKENSEKIGYAIWYLILGSSKNRGSFVFHAEPVGRDMKQRSPCVRQ